MSLVNKVAVVIGGAGHLGSVISKALVKQKVHVVVFDLPHFSLSAPIPSLLVAK